MDLLYKEEAYKIVGAAMEVHKELGCGFLEAIYQEALEKEFILQDIPYKREAHLNVFYKNMSLIKTYIADFICYDTVIIELKALSNINKDHEAQLLNYLKASKLKLGLLINFGRKSLEYKRFVL